VGIQWHRPRLEIRRPALRDGLDLIQIALIVLKLTGVITWSWWWVLAPLWIGVAPVVPIAVGLLILYLWGRWAQWRLQRRLTAFRPPPW
jgi:hypothetical protein